MTEWQAIHLHYSDLDRLILDCVHPFLERHRSRLRRCYWLRHYAGGSHLRVRLQGSRDTVEDTSDQLHAAAESFLAAHPSRDADDYSSQHAAHLLQLETRDGRLPDGEDLTYRNNCLLRQSYETTADDFVSLEAAELMEDFRHDAAPLAARILASARPRREIMLRFFFFQAIFTGGDLRRGSVAWKSHWESFASMFEVEEVLDRIRQTYQRNRESIQKIMLDVKALDQDSMPRGDTLLTEWYGLMIAYRGRVRRRLHNGTHLTAQPRDLDQAHRLGRELDDHILRDSTFVRTMWRDAEFLSLIQYEPRFLVPRVLVNLLYSLVSLVGLNPIEKKALCHHAHRMVEEHFDCDLTDLLRDNITAVKARHAGR